MRILAEPEGCAFGDVEIHVAAQVNGPSQKIAGGYNHAPAAGPAALKYRLLECFAAVGDAVARGAVF
jgi:hypothetical protein